MSQAKSRFRHHVPTRLRAQAARLRIVLGIALSLLFLAITISGIDLPLVGSYMLAASPIGLVTAVAFVAADVGVRAFRWQTLLAGIASVRYRLAFAFLCIGYFANALLPARLGDVARAYLAGNAFQAPRLATLGTIMIERLSDGLIMLATVIIAGALVPPAGAIRDAAVALFLAGVAGLLVLSVGLLVARRTGAHSTRIGALVKGLAGRVMAGTVALRTIGGAVRVVGATVVGLVTAILIVSSVAAAVGLQLSPLQAAVVTAGLALSMAIPAAPGSLGTYEFVGVSILVGLGFPAEASLATIVLVHMIATVPPALAGMVSMWLLHLRVGTIVAGADTPEAVVSRPA